MFGMSVSLRGLSAHYIGSSLKKHGFGCSGTECWLLAEIGESSSLCLDQTYICGWLTEW
jgi:hypothetical protein